MEELLSTEGTSISLEEYTLWLIANSLYWYPTDMDFSSERGWPSSWSNYQPYVQAVEQRLPSTDAPSPDGKRYLEQTYGVMASLLGPMGFQAITINSNPDYKDHVYGYSAYNVRPAFSPII